MDKRTLLAVAVCMGILLAWWKLFPPTPQAPAPSAPTAPAASAPAGGSAPEAAKPSGTAAQPAGPEQRVTLDSEAMSFVLTNWGGTLREAIVTEKKFRRDPQDPRSGKNLIEGWSLETAPLRISFPKADFSFPENAVWTTSGVSPRGVAFRAEAGPVAVEKRYRLDGKHQLHLEILVENRSDKPLAESLALHLYGHQDPGKKGGGFFMGMAEADLAEMVCFVDDSAKRTNIEKLLKEPETLDGAVNWVASDHKYVVLAAVPFPDNAGGSRRCGRRALDAVTGEVYVSLPSRTIAPAGKTSYEFTIFAGPKYISELEAVRPAGVDVKLNKVVDVTFSLLSRPLLFMLQLFHGWIGNWGLAIIMLTLFVKMLTFYPTQRAMLSGKKMQRLGPKMQELRKKHENDRQRLSVETMNLYKTHGVSPFGGCLPTLITMPIWIALFSTLNYAVDLHREPFFGYIHDLSARDPYFITPLLMGGIMFLQMRMSPAGMDPQQQRIMTIMMPVMFTAFSLFLPAGLAIYTLTNSLLAISQQVLVNRLDRRMTAKA